MMRPRKSLLTWLHLMRVWQRIQRRETAYLAEREVSLAQLDVLARLFTRDRVTQ